MVFGSILVASSVVFLTIGVWLSSNDFKPKEYSLPPPPALIGPLALKGIKNAEKILKGQLHGPESLVVEKNTIYTCLLDGSCVKIVDGRIKKQIPLTTHTNCNGERSSMAYCGRPLGIRRFNANKFLVVDAVLGIHLVDFDKGTMELLLSSQMSVDGKRLGFPDDFDFVDNDTIVFTDASTKHGYNDFIIAFLEHSGDGRLLQFKLSTGELRVLIDGLNFPNGVATHPDRRSVLFTESGTARVHRYYFGGPKKGRFELFAANLPGFPDNIRLASSGRTFYVALFGARSNPVEPNFFDRTAHYPIARKIVGEIVQIVPEAIFGRLFEAISSKYGIFCRAGFGRTNGRIIP